MGTALDEADLCPDLERDHVRGVRTIRYIFMCIFVSLTLGYIFVYLYGQCWTYSCPTCPICLLSAIFSPSPRQLSSQGPHCPDVPWLSLTSWANLPARKNQGSIFWSENDIYSPPPCWKIIFFPLSRHVVFWLVSWPFCLIYSLFCIYLSFHFPLSLFLSLSSFFFPIPSFSNFPLFLFLFSYFFRRWYRLITPPPPGGCIFNILYVDPCGKPQMLLEGAGPHAGLGKLKKGQV